MKSIRKKFILGTANFGTSYGLLQKVIKKKEIKHISHSIKENIKIIDTALKYRLPKQKINLIKDFKIITKLGSEKNLNIENSIFRKIRSSLKKYKKDSFEAVLLHDSNILYNKDAIKYVKILKKLKKNRLCKMIGVSIYEPNELKIILKFFKPDLIQAPLNLFDQRLVKSKWYKYLIKNKIKIHVRSIFLKNVLLTEHSTLPKYFIKWQNYFNKYEKFCTKNKISKLEACLNYVFQFKDIQGIVLGVDNIGQLNEIMNVKFIRNKQFLSKLNFLSVKNKKIIDPRIWKI